METLHVRAEHSVIEKVLALLSHFSQEGEPIEILDDTTFNIENEMIRTALQQEKKGALLDHDTVWAELLKK